MVIFGVAAIFATVSLQQDGNVDITFFQSDEREDVNKGICFVPLGPGGTPPIKESQWRSFVDVVYAQSVDGGSGFGPPLRITDETTDWCDAYLNAIPNFGDYNTAVSRQGRVFATWTDGRSGVPDVYFSKIKTGGKAD